MGGICGSRADLHMVIRRGSLEPCVLPVASGVVDVDALASCPTRL